MKATRLDAILRIIQDAIDNDMPPGEAIASLEALSRYAQSKKIPLVEAMTRRLTPTKNQTLETANIPALIVIAFDPTMEAAFRLTSIRNAIKHSASMSFTYHMKAILTENHATDAASPFSLEDYLTQAFGDQNLFTNMQTISEIITQLRKSAYWQQNTEHPSQEPENEPTDTRPPGTFNNLADGESLTRSYSLSNIRKTIKKNGEIKIRFDATCFPNKNYNGTERLLNVHSEDIDLYAYIEKKSWKSPVLRIEKVFGRPRATLAEPKIDTTNP